MAVNTAQGIEKPPAVEDDVNSNAGFEAALAKKGVEPEPGDESSTDTSVASGLEVVDPDQPRTPGGQFAPKETVPDEPDTPTEPAADPLVEEYLKKYDGDVDAAIKAAAHQSRLVGEQGNKLGEQAERLARLEGLVEGLKSSAPPEAVMPTLTNDEISEKAIALADEKGHFGAATDAANIFHATGDKRLYREVIDAWSLESSFDAAEFVADFKMWQREQAVTPSAPDPWVQKNKGVEAMGESLTAVAAERGPDVWAHIAPHMEKALSDLPESVAKLVTSDDAELRLAAIKIVADRATILAGAVTPKAEDTGLPPAVQRKLQGSAVATGSLRPPAAVATGAPQDLEAATKAFKQAILDTETTSVQSGLTFGNQN